MANRFVLNETSYHGKGAIESIPEEAKARGFKKALVCSDPDLVKFGVTAKVTDLLDKAGLAYELYSNIKPNPTIENVQQGVKALHDAGADYMIAIGGGSSMDTAKAVGIIDKNPEFADVRSLEGVAPTKNPCTPIFAVPTTAGTAAEVTINYVITDVEKDRKMVCVDVHDIPVVATKSHPYSMDQNVWHLSHEGGDLENPANAPKDDVYLVTHTPEQAPDEAGYVTVSFKDGVPVAVDGQEGTPLQLLEKLNEIGAHYGVGVVDIVENRLVGMKSRGVYETPGGTILMAAHRQLEELVLDRATMEVKKDMGNKLAQIVYEGKWFTPLCDAVKAFVESTQEYVTGEVKFKLYKGNIIKAGTTSPYSLYSESLASFTTGDLYDHHDADGFITLFGLPLKVRAMKLAELKKENNQK